MWYFSLRYNKNRWKEKKKKLVWIPRNLKHLVIHSRFIFFWWIRQDSSHLELQARFFAKGKKQDSCLNFKKSWISCDSYLILIYLINQTRLCFSWITGKNLISFLSRRILPEYYDYEESCLIFKKNKNLDRTKTRSSTSGHTYAL